MFHSSPEKIRKNSIFTKINTVEAILNQLLLELKVQLHDDQQYLQVLQRLLSHTEKVENESGIAAKIAKILRHPCNFQTIPTEYEAIVATRLKAFLQNRLQELNPDNSETENCKIR